MLIYSSFYLVCQILGVFKILEYIYYYCCKNHSNNILM